jgi:hypothetical protein
MYTIDYSIAQPHTRLHDICLTYYGPFPDESQER